MNVRVVLILRNGRHHVFVKIPGDVQLAEVGPRFEMKRGYIGVPFLSNFMTDSVSV